MDQIEEFLEHHGVKGQHWGIRNVSNRKSSSDYRQSRSLKKKRPAELSNQELKTLNERLNLETNYSRLNPSIVKKGHSKAKEFLAIASTATATLAFFDTGTGKKVIEAGKRFIGPSINKGIRTMTSTTK